jgi:hypothetical protein
MAITNQKIQSRITSSGTRRPSRLCGWSCGRARAARIFYDSIDLGIGQMAISFLERLGKFSQRGPIVGSPEVLLDQPLYILLGGQPVSLGPAAKGCKLRFRELREFQGGNWHRSVTILWTSMIREQPIDEQNPVDSYEPVDRKSRTHEQRDWLVDLTDLPFEQQIALKEASGGYQPGG